MYFHEMERRDRLNSNLSFPVGLVTLLSGAAMLFYKGADFDHSNFDKALLALLCIVAFCLATASYFLIRVYWGHGYLHMPFANDLHEYRQELKEHYISHGDSDSASETKSQDKLVRYVEGEFSKNAKINALVNDAKSALLFKANAFIISAIVFLGLSAPLYLYSESQKTDPIHKIQVVEGETTMTQQEQPQKPEQAPPPKPEQKPEPSPPPSRLVKEHTEKPQEK
jgi:hypothetical protein